MRKISNLQKKTKCIIASVIIVIMCVAIASTVILSNLGNGTVEKLSEGIEQSTEHLNEDEVTHLTEVPEGYIPINTKEDLLAIAKKTANFSNKYILMDNIDLGGVKWTPIGNSSKAFEGTFDGNNYVISKMRPESNNIENGSGMFARTHNATIKNLVLKDFIINNEYGGMRFDRICTKHNN